MISHRTTASPTSAAHLLTRTLPIVFHDDGFAISQDHPVSACPLFVEINDYSIAHRPEHSGRKPEHVPSSELALSLSVAEPTAHVTIWPVVGVLGCEFVMVDAPWHAGIRDLGKITEHYPRSTLALLALRQAIADSTADSTIFANVAMGLVVLVSPWTMSTTFLVPHARTPNDALWTSTSLFDLGELGSAPRAPSAPSAPGGSAALLLGACHTMSSAPLDSNPLTWGFPCGGAIRTDGKSPREPYRMGDHRAGVMPVWPASRYPPPLPCPRVGKGQVSVHMENWN